MAHISEWSADPCSQLRLSYGDISQKILDVMINMEDREDWDSYDLVNRAFAGGLIDNDNLMSHMVYEYKDGRKVRIALEPLIGPLRDPRPICLGSNTGFWTPSLFGSPPEQLSSAMNWVIIDPLLKDISSVGQLKLLLSAPRMPSHKRAMLFDMGGMRWNKEGAAWLNRQMSKIGIYLEHIYIWEANPISGEKIFGESNLDVSHPIFVYQTCVCVCVYVCLCVCE